MINRKLIYTFIFILICAVCGSAQKVEVDQSYIDDATKAFTEVVALRDEVKVKTQTIEDLKNEILRLQVQIAIASTRATELEKQQVSDRAVIQFLLQNTKRRNKIGLIVF